MLDEYCRISNQCMEKYTQPILETATLNKLSGHLLCFDSITILSLPSSMTKAWPWLQKHLYTVALLAQDFES